MGTGSVEEAGVPRLLLIRYVFTCSQKHSTGYRMDFLRGYIGQKLGFLKGVYASELGICQKLENTVHFPSGFVNLMIA